MAGKRIRTNGTIEYVFKRKGVLADPIYVTFPLSQEKEGDDYADRLDKLLDQGIVPAEHRKGVSITTIGELIRTYEREAHPSVKDQQQLATIVRTKGTHPLAAINAAWVDDWISDLKRIEKRKPATITAKVGALARCTDWGMRKGFVTMPDHPLRTLPEGYARYTKTDIAIAGVEQVDTERDRRIERGEDEKNIAAILHGELPRKQRRFYLPDPVALKALYVLARESAMRLREMYTLTIDQVDLGRRTVFLDKTKNGDKRQVPLSTVALSEIEDYLKVRSIPEGHPKDLLFPWWNGDASEKELGDTTHFLSKMWGEIFEVAGSVGFLFHDLRHEATSRLFEKTNLSETQIMKITGHKSHRMMMRYANLRGSDLASKLW